MKNCLNCNKELNITQKRNKKFCSSKCSATYQWKINPPRRDSSGLSSTELHARWRKNNLERYRKTHRDWYTKNKEKMKARQRERYATEPKFRKKMLDYASRDQKSRNKKNRLIVLTHYSDKDFPRCACCGESNVGFLTLHHINGGGKKHREATNNSLATWIVRHNEYPPDLQVLCYNCNLGMDKNGGVCPHKTTKLNTTDSNV